MKLSTAKTRYSTSWRNGEVEWDAFVERLAESRRTSETIAEYLTMSKKQQADIKDVGGFVAGHLREGKRRRGHVLARSMIALDLDYADADVWWTLAEQLPWLSLVYTTHKHTPESPRLRVIIPLAHEITEEQYAPVARKVAEQIGIDLFDDTTYEAMRLMYWPSTASDGEYVCQVFDGPLLDPSEVLGLYSDWTDASTWPLSSRQEQVPLDRGRTQADPLEKEGLVGAFCRAYSVTEAMAEFLPEIYQASVVEDRWTYLPGEAANGVVIYEDKWSYSHHNTDPAGGQLCNAFDLVRHHLFGAQDKDAKPGTPTNRLPSYMAMQDFAREDPAVKRELQSQAVAEFSAITEEEEAEDPNWSERLTFDRRGKVEDTLPNFTLILANNPELRPLAYNEHRQGVDRRGKLPWASVLPGWSDTDEAQLRDYLAERYGIYSPGKTKDAVLTVAATRRYHPVREYFESLPAWDGVERLDTLLIDYLGAEDTAYNRAVIRKTLIAAVTRVYQPGAKFDYVLILVGPQGIGKSTLFAKLAGDWFSDALTMADMKDKTGAEKLQGYLIVEISELAGMRKTEAEAVKSFVSRVDDKYRAPYGRVVESHPRQSIIVGSTNSEEGFLRDTSGNRRFWPTHVSGESIWKPWELSAADVSQVWAEAVAAHRSGESLLLPEAVAQDALRAQRDALESSEWEGLIAEYLDTELPEEWASMELYERRNYLHGGGDFGAAEVGEVQPRESVSTLEIWCECLGRDRSAMRRQDSAEIVTALLHLGWGKLGKKKVPGYGAQWVYNRVVGVRK